jgi:hypothetical protein
MAIEVSSGRLVVVAICEPARLRSLATARGLTHRHLATILDVVRDIPAAAFPDRVRVPSGAGVVVAEHLPGITLRKTLDDGPIHAAKAVAWVLRLADAVQSLHALGVVHGALSPRSVLAGAEGRPIAPVLTQLMVPPVGAFCPPERLRGTAEAPSDDVWALYAILYAMLTGKAPFAGATRDALLRAMGSRPQPLSTFGVEEAALQEIIARGLASERRVRAADLSELVQVLDGWERNPKMLPPPAPPPRPAAPGIDNVASAATSGDGPEEEIVVDDSSLPDDQGRTADVPDDELATVLARPALAALMQASLAQASAGSATPTGLAQPIPPPAAPKRPSINPFARKGNPVPWLVAGALFVIALLYFALRSGSAPAPAPSAAAQQAVPPAPRAPAKPAAVRDPETLRDTCVSAHFAADSFDGSPNFAFVCENPNFAETAERLHAMVKQPVSAGTDAGAADAGAGLRLEVVRAGRGVDGAAGSRLGWYELPATAIIRKTCCPGAEPIALHETPGSCEKLESVVRRLADDSAKSVDLAPVARSFDRAVGCLFAQRIRHGYVYERPPTPANRAHFQQFLSRAAISSARR